MEQNFLIIFWFTRQQDVKYCRSLRVSDIYQLLITCHVQDKVDSFGYISSAHFVETVIKLL